MIRLRLSNTLNFVIIYFWHTFAFLEKVCP
ncbi:hypothetical protein SPHINGO391_500046 [Sphingomonas aurantiaca]|uniref:Uncharacterized protein n=1 Tax=Sphingomonas aurantiaca TaxID=185949 RepID=A0A5E8AFC1_9SPHN|nr:hypothetical protein SPHINGO391_500046 [Sphingomonas aurantiaca]